MIRCCGPKNLHPCGIGGVGLLFVCLIKCSAMGQQRQIVEAIQSGARDFIVKPFQGPRVLEAVSKIIWWRLDRIVPQLDGVRGSDSVPGH